MKRILFSFLLLVLAPGSAMAAPAPQWKAAQVARLIEWMKAAESEGLGTVAADLPVLRSALTGPDDARLNDLATASAIRLLEAHRHGCCNAALRANWHIPEQPAWPDARASLIAALEQDRLDELFRSTRPSHPFYGALAQAFAKETDRSRRAGLAANLDRWRWMPRQLGPRYLLVNTAAFEATLWENGDLAGRWRVVVGKTKSPTPVFRATVTGVIFNPWWEIPPSIAAEGIAGLVTRNPAEAARKGYVRENGRYRQRPGPQNALGRMKLVMPNRFNVYLHDTPAQSLFNQDVRAYSHGCVRVGDALGLASALLGSRWEQSRVDAVVAAGSTQNAVLPSPVPVYIAYFTAEPDGLGGVRYFPDTYHRDRGALVPNAEGQCTR
jgi:L,D-transpeptidase YcbB